MLTARQFSRLLAVGLLFGAASQPLYSYDGLAGDETDASAESVSVDSASSSESADSFATPVTRHMDVVPGSNVGSLAVAPQVRVPVLLEVRANVEVLGERMWLSDFAQCSGSALHCRDMTNVDLGAAPLPSRSLRLSRAQILTAASAEWKNAELSGSGAEFVRVSSPGEELHEADVRAALDSYLAALDDDKVRHRSQRVSLFGKVWVRPGGGVVEFPELGKRSGDAAAGDEKMEGTRTLKAEFVGHDSGTRIPFAVSVSLVREVFVPVAARAITSGTFVRDDDVVQRWVRRRSGTTDLIAESRSAVEGRSLRIQLAEGQPFPVRAFVKPLVVRRGEMVQYAMSAGELGVNLRVESMGQGGIGDAIDVVVPDSKRRIRVRIVGKGRVEAM